MLFIRLSNDLAHRVDVFIIGQRLGADTVGLYQRSFHLVTIPLYQFTSAVNTVLFPAMATLQDETSRFRNGYLGSVGLTSMLAFPVLTLLWTTADLVMPLLYGPKWSGTVPILMSLAAVAYFRVANNPNGLVTQARGRVMAEALCQAAFMIFTALFAFLGSFYGVQGVVAGIGVASLFFLVMMTKVALAISGVPFSSWAASFRTPIFSSVAMAIIVLASKTALVGSMPDSLLLLTVISCGAITYGVTLRHLLNARERQLLERFLPMVPVRFRDFFRFCIRSTVTDL
jgi:O-antigen/teichoic acid export membrane protein